MTAGGRHDDRGTGGAAEADDLVALLYGELGGDDERVLRARVSADPALSGRLAEMEQVRELFRGLEDEEPPSRISAQLMAAAAARGAEAESRPGFFARLIAWMQPVLARPGLAAAMSVLLVAGVASVLLVRKGSQLTKVEHAPELSRAPETAAEGGASAPTSAPAAPPAPAEVPSSDFEQPAVGGAESAAQAPTEESAEESIDEVKLKKAPAPRRSYGRAERATGKSDEPVAGDTSADPAAGPPVDQARAAAPEPPSPTPTAEGEESGSAESAPEKDVPTQGIDRDQQISLQRLHEQAVTAAVNRRCLEVRTLAQTIRKADPGYHDRVFVTDSRLSVCLFAGKPARKK